MEVTTKAMDRVEEWLRETPLPELAKNCIENFVCSCDKRKIVDLDNFICVDIVNFTPEVQAKLIMGYVYAYYGLKPAMYQPENMPECYRVNLN